jgi:3-oxoacyl-[acyl-carrier protein] reductase
VSDEALASSRGEADGGGVASGFSRKVAIVTGSAKNIGKAIALELARAGAAVVVNARSSATEAEAVAAEIRQAGGRAAVVLADVKEPAGADTIVAAAVAAFGRIDVLVNNASVRREVDFDKLEYAEWREILGTTLDGAYLCSRAALPHLIAAGGGSIVNIGGLSSHTGATRRAHVIAAKAGLVGLTRALAHDLAPHQITVNCVAPGVIDTSRGAKGDPAHHAIHKPLVGRRGRPEEIAALVTFLCGNDARYITGQTIHANGGTYMG